jgi:hypothetical protein
MATRDRRSGFDVSTILLISFAVGIAVTFTISAACVFALSMASFFAA